MASAGAGSTGQGIATWGVSGGTESLVFPINQAGLSQAPVPPGGAAAGAQAKMTIDAHNVYDVPGGGAAVPAHQVLLTWFVFATVSQNPVGSPPAGVGQEHASFSGKVKYKINGAAADLDPIAIGVQDTSSIVFSTPLGVPGVFF